MELLLFPHKGKQPTSQSGMCVWKAWSRVAASGSAARARAKIDRP